MDEVLAREFVIAANQMNRSLMIYQEDRGHRESRGSLLECATIGCSLLSNDMYVQALVEDARTFQERRRFHRRDTRIITGSTHFEYFLEIEGRLLEVAGIDEGLTGAIIDQCREARKATRHGKFDAYAFNHALLQLRHAVCGVFIELREDTFDESPPYQPSHRLASVLKGVCGCVLVGLDASILAPAVGLSAAGSAVSIAVGGAIVGQAYTELSGAGCYPRLLLRRLRRRTTEVRQIS